MRCPIKIAFIGSRGFPGFNAGVEKSLEEICPKLADKGHEVTLYCSDKVTTQAAVYKQTRLKRIPAIPTKHFETLSRTFLSTWHALFEKYDIIHFHSIGPALLSWLPKCCRHKTVVTVHGLDWQRAKWGRVARTLLRTGEYAAAYFPDETIVVSKYLKRYYKQQHDKDVVFIPNGVNINQHIPAQIIWQKWGLSPQSYIFFASRLVPEKECHTLIQAFKRVQTDKKLVIAGASWHSDAYAAELKKMAEGDPRILFLGWAEGEMLSELYSNAYLYCLPSSIEGLSLGLLEAMSFGCCPLVSDIPENTDVIESNGSVFKTGDVDDLTAKLTHLISHPAEAKRLGEAAKKHVLSEYSWDRNCEELEKAYTQILERRGTKR